MADFEIRWQAPEFEYKSKDVSWYWASIIVTLLILAIAVWQKNFLFGFFVILAEVLFMTWGNRKPRLINFVINQESLSIVGQKTYPYNEIESFSIEKINDAWSELTIRLKRKFRPPIKIALPQNQSQDIEKALQNSLQQSEPVKSIMDDLENFSKF